MLHADKSSIVNQREVGTDTADFHAAMKRVLRQDPDVILVGEMRDSETVQHRARRGRDRPPRVLDAAHHQRHGLDQPHHRLLPAPRAAADPHVAGRLAAGHREPASRRASHRRPGRRRWKCWSRRAACSTRSSTPKRRTRSKRSSPRASSTACRPSTRASSTSTPDGVIELREAMAASTSPHDLRLMIEQWTMTQAAHQQAAAAAGS